MVQWRLEFSRQIAVDLKADADFDEDGCSPSHRVPPLRLRLRWTVGQPIQPVSNEMLRGAFTTNRPVAERFRAAAGEFRAGEALRC
jgi:hypothetical protein